MLNIKSKNFDNIELTIFSGKRFQLGFLNAVKVMILSRTTKV